MPRPYRGCRFGRGIDGYDSVKMIGHHDVTVDRSIRIMQSYLFN